MRLLEFKHFNDALNKKISHIPPSYYINYSLRVTLEISEGNINNVWLQFHSNPRSNLNVFFVVLTCVVALVWWSARKMSVEVGHLIIQWARAWFITLDMLCRISYILYVPNQMKMYPRSVYHVFKARAWWCAALFGGAQLARRDGAAHRTAVPLEYRWRGLIACGNIFVITFSRLLID